MAQHSDSDAAASSAPPSGAWCPEFRPTRDEFASFATYMRTVVEPQCAHIGICKIVPPRGWFSRSYALDALEQVCAVTTPVSQHVAGKKGIFNVDLVERKSLSVREFKALADTLGGSKHEPADLHDVDAIERAFWKSLRPTMDAPVYGADIVNSLFGDDPALSWNLNRLDTILKRIDLPGVTRAMLYFGMWQTMFAFHTEDMDLYSINYLHTGKPKFWYAVPPQFASQLERAAQSMFPEKHHECNQFLRHKTSLISPTRLKAFGVPFYKAFHQPGEFVITFPATYHEGFNVGFNIAEAVNFASLRWIPFGLKAKVCKCSPDSVRIDMDAFLTRLFDDAPASNRVATLGSSAWVFSCACGKFHSSEDPNYAVEGQWFECSQCEVWAHLGCVHPDLAHLTSDELPQAILCHRCRPPDPDAAPSMRMSKRRTPTKKKVVAPAAPARTPKRVKTSDSPLEKRRKPSAQDRNASMRSPSLQSTPTKTARAPSRKQSSGNTPTKRQSSSPLVRKSHFVKGSTIYLKDDAEAKVVAVQGNMMRVHYKVEDANESSVTTASCDGQSVDDDEWLPMSSRDLRERIKTISPPRPVRNAKGATH